MEQMTEERQEICSTASKLVNIKIGRRRAGDEFSEWEICSFDCNNKSTNCENRCTYRLLLEDY